MHRSGREDEMAARAGKTDPWAGLDGEQYREAIARIPRTAALLSSTIGDEEVTALADGIVSVSVDPPLLLVSVDRQERVGKAIDDSGGFVVGVLSEAQQNLVGDADARPGTPGQAGDLLASIDPAQCVVRLGCRVTERMTSGSHLVLVGLACDLAAADGPATTDPRRPP